MSSDSASCTSTRPLNRRRNSGGTSSPISRGVVRRKRPPATRIVTRCDAEPIELVADRRDHLVPRADLCRRDRQRRLLDHDRRRAAARHQLRERPAGERDTRALRAPRRRRPRCGRAATAGAARCRPAPARRRRPASPTAVGRASHRRPAHAARSCARCAAAAETPSAMKMPPVTYRRTRAPTPVRRMRPASASASSA